MHPMATAGHLHTFNFQEQSMQPDLGDPLSFLHLPMTPHVVANPFPKLLLLVYRREWELPHLRVLHFPFVEAASGDNTALQSNSRRLWGMLWHCQGVASGPPRLLLRTTFAAAAGSVNVESWPSAKGDGGLETAKSPLSLE